jgi:hypothetical protein
MSACKPGALLALAPTARGLGFIVIDGEYRLCGWGVKEARGGNKNGQVLRCATALMERYTPSILVIEDIRTARRHPRLVTLFAALTRVAKAHDVEVRRFTRSALRAHFGVHTKHAIAEEVAKAIPLLAVRMPPKRKLWTSEDARQALFDAAALALLALPESDTPHAPKA